MVSNEFQDLRFLNTFFKILDFGALGLSDEHGLRSLRLASMFDFFFKVTNYIQICCLLVVWGATNLIALIELAGNTEKFLSVFTRDSNAVLNASSL